MKSSRVGDLIPKLFMLLIGIMFVIPPVYKLYTYCSFRYRSISVYGVVSDHSRGRGMGGRPFVKFADQSGNHYEIKSQAKTHWFYAPRQGEKIRVFYLKDAPQVAIVDSTFHYIVFPLSLVIIGSFIIAYVFTKGSSKDERV